MDSNNTDYSSTLLVVGGAFQGKSLLSIKLAAQHAFSTVLSTDLFRNVLRVKQPDEAILCPTSRLNEEIFNEQRRLISELMQDTLAFYTERKEKVIVEGVHFSKEFLRNAVAQGASCVCLDNLLPWSERVEYKRLTTPITRGVDLDTGQESLIEHTQDLKVENISYLYKENLYKRIHQLVLADAKELGIQVVAFSSMDEAFHEVSTFIKKS